MSEAPKREPIARKYDSRHELDDAKTTDEQKEEVGWMDVIFHPYCRNPKTLNTQISAHSNYGWQSFNLFEQNHHTQEKKKGSSFKLWEVFLVKI